MQENPVSIKITAAELQQVTAALKVVTDTLTPYLGGTHPRGAQGLAQDERWHIAFCAKGPRLC